MSYRVDGLPSLQQNRGVTVFIQATNLYIPRVYKVSMAHLALHFGSLGKIIGPGFCSLELAHVGPATQGSCHFVRPLQIFADNDSSEVEINILVQMHQSDRHT